MNKEIAIAGGGPVGSLLSIYLSRKGYKVTVFEKRPDPRKGLAAEGRSINLALSHRGLRALEDAGLRDLVLEQAVPMKGRMMHSEKGNLTFQPYGEEGQMIYSVSRSRLNELIIEKAEKEHGTVFHFQASCEAADPESTTLTISSDKKNFTFAADAILAADGAFSSVRKSFQQFPDFSSGLENLSHGYKELHLPPSAEGGYLMEKNALHIWPRGQFMLIALPNTDGSFTCTLFLPMKGKFSFEEIQAPKDLAGFFREYFPDVIPLMPALEENYFNNPVSSLVTLHCFPWYYHNTLLVGDAAHAITPFYGQGMNAGFEDCRIFNGLVDECQGNWQKVFARFQELRKENAGAIAQLALQNFIEMRDLVADEKFLLRKKIEAAIHRRYPGYLPLYTMVTFSDIPYKEALHLGKEHDQMMEKIMELDEIGRRWQSDEGWVQIDKVLSTYLKKQELP